MPKACLVNLFLHLRIQLSRILLWFAVQRVAHCCVMRF